MYSQLTSSSSMSFAYNTQSVFQNLDTDHRVFNYNHVQPISMDPQSYDHLVREVNALKENNADLRERLYRCNQHITRMHNELYRAQMHKQRKNYRIRKLKRYIRRMRREWRPSNPVDLQNHNMEWNSHQFGFQQNEMNEVFDFVPYFPNQPTWHAEE